MRLSTAALLAAACTLAVAQDDSSSSGSSQPDWTLTTTEWASWDSAWNRSAYVSNGYISQRIPSYGMGECCSLTSLPYADPPEQATSRPSLWTRRMARTAGRSSSLEARRPSSRASGARTRLPRAPTLCVCTLTSVLSLGADDLPHSHKRAMSSPSRLCRRGHPST